MYLSSFFNITTVFLIQAPIYSERKGAQSMLLNMKLKIEIVPLILNVQYIM